MPGMYILVDGRPVEEKNVLRWGEWMEKPSNLILVRTKVGEVTVSTVFLGLDHSYSSKGPPVLWETLVFGGRFDDTMRRYTNLEDAKAGHEEYVRMVRLGGLGPKAWSPRAKEGERPG